MMLYNMNLKQLLMDLGNLLVLEHGFDPATAPSHRPNTWPIRDFTEWLNGCPEARRALADMGVDWPIV